MKISQEEVILMSFPVMYSTLSDKALSDYISINYDLEEIIDCRLLLRGMNDTYYIVTENSKYVFRVYRRPWRTNYSEVAFEMDLLNYLKDNGVPVSYPLRTVNQDYIQRFEAPEGIRFGALFTFAEGDTLSMDSEVVSFNYGKSVANIHLKSEGFITNNERPHLDIHYLIEEPLEIIKHYLSHRPADYDYLSNIGRLMSAKLSELQMNGLDWGICHGDLHGANAHFKESTFTHFDFDICGYGWRAYDLAVFKFTREFEIRNEREKIIEFNNIWNSFLAGYQSVRNLNQSDIDAIPIFCGIRQLWLMKLSLQYFRDQDIIGSIDAEEKYFKEELDYFRKMEYWT